MLTLTDHHGTTHTIVAAHIVSVRDDPNGCTVTTVAFSIGIDATWDDLTARIAEALGVPRG